MVEFLQRPLSKLLFASCELYEEGQITREQRHLLKGKIFSNDKNLFQAVEDI